VRWRVRRNDNEASSTAANGNPRRIGDDEGVLVEAGGPSISTGGKKKKGGKK